MQMHLRNISIDSIFFEKNRDFDFENGDYNLSYNIALDNHFEPENNILTIDLRVSTPPISDENQVPLAFNVLAGGVFQFEEQPNDEVLDKFKYINCPAIIFPYLREAVADFVRRSGLPPIHLPPVNFIKMKQEFERQMNDEIESKE